MAVADGRPTTPSANSCPTGFTAAANPGNLFAAVDGQALRVLAGGGDLLGEFRATRPHQGRGIAGRQRRDRGLPRPGIDDCHLRHTHTARRPEQAVAWVQAERDSQTKPDDTTAEAARLGAPDIAALR